MPVNSNHAQDIRLRFLYRGMVLRGKACISLDAARRLIGPDCAFRLYARLDRLHHNDRKGAQRSIRGYQR
jgi:hypothetical protein